MHTLEDIQALHPELRAFTLVGAFMAQFGLLESALSDALATMLKLEGLNMVIIMRNMQFSDKVRTFRTLVDMYIWPREEKKKYDDLAKQMLSLADDRNMIAHTVFKPSQISDGVDFLLVRAAKKLEFPDMDWPVAKFAQVIQNMENVQASLQGVKSQMAFSAIAKALLERNPAPGGLAGLFALGASLDDLPAPPPVPVPPDPKDKGVP
jgi:hypothetical protein